MKKILLLFITAMSAMAYGQKCCLRPAGDKMVAFASNDDFHAAHLAPEDYQHIDALGTMVSLNTSDGTDGMAYFIPSNKPSKKVLFVFHEWWGLNDHIKREADELFQSLKGEVSVYAFDLYDGKIATSPEEAGNLMGTLKPERAINIIKGGIAKLPKDAQIATIGWCMGGSWSFQAAVEAGVSTKACVMYYGFPETNKTRLAALKSDILYIQALKDDFITKETVTNFENDLKAAHKKITIQGYEAVHAFANPSNPKHDAKFTEDALKISLEYLKRGLKIK